MQKTPARRLGRPRPPTDPERSKRAPGLPAPADTHSRCFFLRSLPAVCSSGSAEEDAPRIQSQGSSSAFRKPTTPLPSGALASKPSLAHEAMRRVLAGAGANTNCCAALPRRGKTKCTTTKPCGPVKLIAQGSTTAPGTR